eukprot:1808332-Pyramimonas_sp.AAC.1
MENHRHPDDLRANVARMRQQHVDAVMTGRQNSAYHNSSKFSEVGYIVECSPATVSAVSHRPLK